ncbi:IS3 family transposase [Massilia endophytica]|uniref:IS3 family transposase n=1 Tax=Massilia endophytica TaxID=2899220 RepID=UPI001E2E614A|nr:IS3 family transposase [Massilia endophytica]UGQ44989.1 IS3 family transposase [Massilia endophytica]UGQ46065.1 IS3 family transposase [Massilia endophytica]UGQ46667.1 IS3 family transposase [Massilia endophytica]UGQ48817.1 IS3 family transposase [Massilia endophytica]
MTKYDEKFKLAVVQQYLRGGAGYRTIAQEHRVAYGMVRRWVESFRAHGVGGLKKKFSHYSAEFKLSVLRHMWENELSYGQTAAQFNIRNPGILAAWGRSYENGGLDALQPGQRGKPSKMATATEKTEDSPNDDTRTREELLAEVNHLRMEVAYLKKLRALSSTAEGDSRQKAQVVQELRQQYPIAGLLKLAKLPRSTFYYQQKVLQGGDKHAQVKEQIKTIFNRHQGRYGYRRVTAAVRQLGLLVNHKKVQRLMGTLGLKSLVRPKKYRSFRGEVGRAASNELNRQFQADAANQKWVTDVTEFNVAGRKLYLSPVLDLYNGEIVAFETAERPKFELVSSMLKQALAKLGPNDKPMLHSDQGWQYRMPAYQRQLHQRELVQSMSRKGNCLDNAAMESFFAVLKTEFFYLNKFNSVEELRAGLKRYIHYYNHDRIKLKLKGLSPVQFRTQPLAA